ncbi:MAG: hypothetical protein HYY00_04665 [Chloroflexi bacterium]|nr:hypothetical protein [Chloroflexota bacterium]
MAKGWRWLLPTAAVTGLLLMAACAGAEPTATPTPTPTKPPAVVATPTPTATATPTGPKTGGILRAAMVIDPRGMDPMATTGSTDRSFTYDICDTLVNFDLKGVADPKISLAESWQISQDGLTYTFKLRKAKFQDGTDVDAEAVKISLDRARDKTTGFGYAAQLSAIKAVDVVDPSTVKITVNAVSAPFLLNLAERGGTALSPKALKEKGEKFQAEPVCAGAFQVKDWQPGTFWETKKFQDYWGKPLPYLDGIKYNVIADGRVRVAALESGGADLAELEAEDANLMAGRPGLNLYRFLGYGFRGIKWNRAIPPMDDIRVRQAIVKLVDTEAMNRAIYGGHWKIATGGEIPDVLWAWTDLSDVRERYKYDPKAAAELIKQTGLSTPIKVKMVSAQATESSLEAEFLQGMLNNSGLFAVTVDRYTSAENNRLAFEEHSYPLTITGIGLRVDPDGMMSITMTSKSFYNLSRDVVDDFQKRLDDLTSQAARTLDQAERKRLYAEAQRIQLENLVHTYPQFYRARLYGYRAVVKNSETMVGADGMLRLKDLWLDK